MYKYFITLFLVFISLTAFAKQIRVGIIDTGLDPKDPRFSYLLCKDTPYLDFTGRGIKDTMGHGTHVAGLIKKYAGDSDYCIVILKFYDDSMRGIGTDALIPALNRVEDLKLDIINISAGGANFNNEERDLLARNIKTIFVMAAGNNGVDLDRDCIYYPACYSLPNIIIVGNLNPKGGRTFLSNYGKRVKAWEVGKQKSTLPDFNTDFPEYNNKGYMDGTSMSCAVHTGKMIGKLYEKTR